MMNYFFEIVLREIRGKYYQGHCIRERPWSHLLLLPFHQFSPNL